MQNEKNENTIPNSRGTKDEREFLIIAFILAV